MKQCSWLVVTVLTCAVTTYGQRPIPLPDIPDWAQHARWYYINVPLFRNGDKNNDPTGATPLPMDWPDLGNDHTYAYPPAKRSPQNEVGDLTGVIDKLDYLKQLGVNALLLSPILTRGSDGQNDLLPLRHVDPSVGTLAQSSDVSRKKHQSPHTISPSDQMLITLMAKAHHLDMRIAIEIDCKDLSNSTGDTESQVKALHQLISKWLDPNADGHPVDGVDGVAFRNVHTLTKPVWQQWIVRMKRTNTNLLTIGPGQESMFDTQINHHLATTITRFFQPSNTSYTAKQFIEDMATAKKRYGPRTGNNTIIPISTSRQGRVRSFLEVGTSGDKRTSADDFRRLAMIFQYFYSGVPITYFGDEIGMTEGISNRFSNAMWWSDSRQSNRMNTIMQGEFYALYKLLNGLRKEYEPIIRGDFSLVKDDPKSKILAVSRSLSSERIVLVINYSTSPQRVELTSNHPNKKLAILSPQTKSAEAHPLMKRRGSGTNPSKIPQFQIGGEQQIAGNDGSISFWVNPMSMRLLLDFDPKK